MNAPCPINLNPLAVKLGATAARHVFAKRGDHSEAHLSERELSVIISAAIHVALERSEPK